tara:strand:+ start:276 stop:524 length:249 start_codon:yes stop_codon:yes gene_type:complete
MEIMVQFQNNIGNLFVVKEMRVGRTWAAPHVPRYSLIYGNKESTINTGSRILHRRGLNIVMNAYKKALIALREEGTTLRIGK